MRKRLFNQLLIISNNPPTRVNIILTLRRTRITYHYHQDVLDNGNVFVLLECFQITPYSGQNGPGGVLKSAATSEADCREMCKADTTCVGFDWGLGSCYHNADPNVVNVLGTIPGNTFYLVNRICPGKYRCMQLVHYAELVILYVMYSFIDTLNYMYIYIHLYIIWNELSVDNKQYGIIKALIFICRKRALSSFFH